MKCDTCDLSLRLEPSNKEIKSGFAEARLYCCNILAARRIGLDTVPQLAEIVREKGGCGTLGIWWTAIVEAPPKMVVPTSSKLSGEALHDEVVHIRTPYVRPKLKITREPYKLEMKP